MGPQAFLRAAGYSRDHPLPAVRDSCCKATIAYLCQSDPGTAAPAFVIENVTVRDTLTADIEIIGVDQLGGPAHCRRQKVIGVKLLGIVIA